jgi:DNA polymerase-4
MDLDAFFCSVEELLDPALKGKAFIVGGRAEQRGVVASASYPARAFGVRSVMPTAVAQRLCPGLIVVSGRHRIYGEWSHKVMERLHAVTPLVEQLSIDEAFLDVSDLPGSGEALARRLQGQIRDEVGLPSSFGVASNFDPADLRGERLAQAIDGLRARYGGDAVRRASALADEAEPPRPAG